MDQLRRTIAGYATHVNLAATLIIGLGCERNKISDLVEIHNLTVGPKLQTFIMQDVGGTRKSIEAGVKAVKELLPETFTVIDVGWRKGVLHRNTASRYKSRMARQAQAVMNGKEA